MYQDTFNLNGKIYSSNNHLLLSIINDLIIIFLYLKTFYK